MSRNYNRITMGLDGRRFRHLDSYKYYEYVSISLQREDWYMNEVGN